MKPIILAALCASLPRLAGAEGGPLSEDAARISENYRGRAQAALDAVFGPGRAAARVEAEIVLTPEAKGWVDRTLAPPAVPKPGAAAVDLDAAVLGTGETAEDGQFVLPGYADERPRGPAAVQRPPEARPSPSADLLRAFGTEVSRVQAVVSLDTALPAGSEERAAALVREALRLSDARGDTLVVRREGFPPAWRRLLADPSLLAGLAGRGLMLAAAALAALALWRTGTALRAGLEGATARLAAALSRPTDRSMELNLGGSASLGREGPLQFLGGGAAAGGGPPGQPPASVPEDPFFGIGPHDAPKLHHLLKDQPPEHVALVLPHLKPETREALLGLLPKERSAAVLGTMVPVRFVDPDILKEVRRELERRIDGVVGGIEYAAEMLRSLPSARRDELLRLLRERDPEAAAALRGSVLLLEDLQRLDTHDLEVLIRETTVEELAAACGGLPDKFLAAVSAALPRRSAALLKELIQMGGAELVARAEPARERMLDRAETLIREGRIKRPPVLSTRIGHETKP